MARRLDLIDQFTELVVGADDPRRLAERTLEVVMSLLNGRSAAVFTCGGADVTLFASPIAVTGRTCGSPIVRCGNAPKIQFAGLMPLSNLPGPAAPYYDLATGYARRPNRPRPSGNPADPPGDPNLTETPFTRTLQLYGCAEIKGASFYRLLYSYNGGGQVPFVGLSWNLYRMVAGVLQILPVTADGAGWYPIVPSADNWHPHDMLLEWPTGAEGRYEITLQLGNAAKNPLPAKIDEARAGHQAVRGPVRAAERSELQRETPLRGRGSLAERNSVSNKCQYIRFIALHR